MSDSEYLRSHEKGCEALGQGTGIPDSFKALSGALEQAFSEAHMPDSIIAALGGALLRYQESNRTATDLQAELRECRDSLAEWHGRALKAEALIAEVREALS